MSVKEEIQETIRILKQMRKFKSQADIAVHLNYNPSYFSRTLNSEIIPMDFEEIFFKAFPKSVYLSKTTTQQKLTALSKIDIDGNNSTHSDPPYKKEVVPINNED